MSSVYYAKARSDSGYKEVTRSSGTVSGKKETRTYEYSKEIKNLTSKRIVVGKDGAIKVIAN